MNNFFKLKVFLFINKNCSHSLKKKNTIKRRLQKRIK